jgi:hypothetical protein
MVRILKVKALEERKRLVLTQSEMYRQTMRLEIANVKYSVALLKRKLKFLKSGVAALGVLVPLAGLLFARRKAAKGRQPPKEQGGIFAKLLSGVRLFRMLQPILQGFAAGRRASKQSQERESMTQFP